MYAGELTLRLPLHECISHIYIFIIDLFFTPLLMIDKKGENDFEFKLSLYMHIYSLSLCLYKKREKDFESLNKKGEKSVWEKDF